MNAASDPESPVPPRPGGPDVLCIGSMLWDVIGHSVSHMRLGSDVPGRIGRIPGGVALNVAMALRKHGMTPALLSAVGDDPEGRELLERCRTMGLVTRHVYVSQDLPTDHYMAIEGANGLIAAIADAHSLEHVGAKILAPLRKGDLSPGGAPWEGLIALDGNLTEALLAEIAQDAAFARADLRMAPASPGKVLRLLPLLGHPGSTLYVNLEEASLLCGCALGDASEAAEAMVAKGAHRVLVTNGAAPAAEAGAAGIRTLQPPEVLVTRVTGAGDSFMAAHMAAEARGADPDLAFRRALDAAAAHVSGDTAL